MPELLAKLASSPGGLSQAEAQKQRAEYGPNEIEEKKVNPLLKFLGYFWGPIPWMIEAAVVLSALVGSLVGSFFCRSCSCCFPTPWSDSG